MEKYVSVKVSNIIRIKTISIKNEMGDIIKRRKTNIYKNKNGINPSPYMACI